MTFDKLKATDNVLIQRGSNSYKTDLNTLGTEIGSNLPVKTVTSLDDAGAGTIPDRDSIGDIYVRTTRNWLPANSVMTDWNLTGGGGIMYRNNDSDDSFVRVCNDMDSLRTAANLVDRNGLNVVPGQTWEINITGSASSATNADFANSASSATTATSASSASTASYCSGQSEQINVKDYRTDDSGYGIFFGSFSGATPGAQDCMVTGGSGFPRIMPASNRIVAANIAGYFGVTSRFFGTIADARAITNSAPIADATSLVRQLNPQAYDLHGSATFGFTASEVKSIIPGIVNGDETADSYALDEDEVMRELDLQTVDLTKLVPILTKALQEALTRIDELEANTSASSSLERFGF